MRRDFLKKLVAVPFAGLVLTPRTAIAEAVKQRAQWPTTKPDTLSAPDEVVLTGRAIENIRGNTVVAAVKSGEGVLIARAGSVPGNPPIGVCRQPIGVGEYGLVTIYGTATVGVDE